MKQLLSLAGKFLEKGPLVEGNFSGIGLDEELAALRSFAEEQVAGSKQLEMRCS